MRRVSVWRTIEAPAGVLWSLLTDLDRWPDWGPTVRRARIEGENLMAGAHGTLTTIVGLDLEFEITEYSEGTYWAWKVAGLPATDHTVEQLSAQRCRVGFGVPWPAAGYLAVCQVALQRLETMALEESARA
ncbi:MAG: SRPBCC family protein [Acidimicrobiia bacterium]|nr:SRPBCC family protein [Acidimicrobiia bacterium]